MRTALTDRVAVRVVHAVCHSDDRFHDDPETTVVFQLIDWLHRQGYQIEDLDSEAAEDMMEVAAQTFEPIPPAQLGRQSWADAWIDLAATAREIAHEIQCGISQAAPRLRWVRTRCAETGSSGA